MTATLTPGRFAELASTKGRVDTNAGILYGVKLLGRMSQNNREYAEHAMRDAVSLYDGKKVFVNHPESSKLDEDRKFQDWVGVIESPRFESGAIYGNIRLRKASPHYADVIEAATEFGGAFGCSHVADGDSRMDRGTEIVETITRVDSVDLVLTPATTRGLFESFVSDGGDGDEFYQALDALSTLGVDFEALQALADAYASVRNMIDSRDSPIPESYRPSTAPSFVDATTFDSAAKFATRYR